MDIAILIIVVLLSALFAHLKIHPAIAIIGGAAILPTIVAFWFFAYPAVPKEAMWWPIALPVSTFYGVIAAVVGYGSAVWARRWKQRRDA